MAEIGAVNGRGNPGGHQAYEKIYKHLNFRNAYQIQLS